MIKTVTYRIDTPRGTVVLGEDKDHCLGLWHRYYSRIAGAKFFEITTIREEKILEKSKDL